MNESYITVSTEYVVRLANEQLAKVQEQAEVEFDLYVARLVKRANLQIVKQHQKVDARKKSFFKFLMPKSWLTYLPKYTLEDAREQILTEFKNVEHPALRMEFDKEDLLASIVDDPSVTWPTLWKLANINVKGIEHQNRLKGIKPSEATMQLSLTHARLIRLIF